MMNAVFRSLVLSALCFLLSDLSLAVNYPKPGGYVTDTSNLLSPADRQSLEQRISDIEKQTTAEIAIVTLPSLGGESLEKAAVDLFKQWGIGKKDKNNGILLLIVPSERKMRIEVGYGLESVLPDGLCGQIIREQLAPSFRNGQYYQGLNQALEAISGVLTGQRSIIPRAEVPSEDPAKGGGLWVVLFSLGLVLFRYLPLTTIGLFLMGVVFYTTDASWWSRIGLLVFPVGGFCLDRIIRWKDILSGISSGSSGNDDHWHRGSGGGFSGGGFGGGGFGGFGGGSSGGGGASGGW